MVILCEKDVPALPPPPPYNAQSHDDPGPPQGQRWRGLSSLPSHILLKIVYETLPSQLLTVRLPAEARMGWTTRVLYWIATSARMVNRGFYLASMHILRSTYLPAYTHRIKQPYTSDPFPHTSSIQASRNVLSMQRETAVLDHFLLLTLRESVCTDDSALHLSAFGDSPTSAASRDLFAFMQPRARLEDLVRDFGVGAGLVLSPFSTFPTSRTARAGPSQTRASSSTHPYPSSSSSPSSHKSNAAASASMASLPTYASHTHLPAYTSRAPRVQQIYHAPPTSPTRVHRHALPASALSITLAPRQAGLVLTSRASSHARASKRTIVSTTYDRGEPLERCASRLVKLLKGWCDECAGL